MTRSLRPPSGDRARRLDRRAERVRRVDGAARRWLMFIAFGVIPLIGVLALSFTTWDGIGEITPAGLDSWRHGAHRPRPAARAVGDVPGDGAVLGCSRRR